MLAGEKHNIIQSHRRPSTVFHELLLLLVLSIACTVEVSATTPLESDKQCLLEIKAKLQHYNPVYQGNYTLWRPSDQDPCSWPGVTCGAGGARVTALDMRGSFIACNLSVFSPDLKRLTALEHLDLSQNFLSGAIPVDLHVIQGLRHLNLSHNRLSGELQLLPGLAGLKELDLTLNRFEGDVSGNFPEACGELVLLNMSMNNFTGDVRRMFERCPKLRYLDISTNRFTGEVWSGVAVFREFCASENNLSGVVPPDIFPSTTADSGDTVGCALEVLDVSQNQLRGQFPATVSNCRALRVLNLWGNAFDGPIPPSIGQLSALEGLFLGNNRFDREIPRELLNCSRLDFLDLSKNDFTGEIQPVLGRFVHVRFLVLHSNNYTGGIEESGILKLPRVERLDLSFNQFSGKLPLGLVSMPRLKYLILAFNNFSGSIPPEFGNMAELQALDLSYNRLTGSIPQSLGNLTSLLWLMLGNNSLTGEIPKEIGRCRSLLWFNLANNRLSGSLPPALFDIGSDPRPTFEKNKREERVLPASGECLSMRRWIPASYPPFKFSFELLNRKSCRIVWDRLLKGYGIIPVCANTSSAYRSLTISGYLQVTGNNLSGAIPPEIGRLRNFSLLHLDQNAFTGQLPRQIARLPLGVLNVSKNAFSGPIPREIGGMTCLQNLDLSVNNFSGEFPGADFNKLSELSHFNVSYNPFLTGEVPQSGQMATFSDESFLGDPLLRRRFGTAARNETDDGLKWRRKKRRPVAFFVFLGFSCTFVALGFLALLICMQFRPPPVRNQPDDDESMFYRCSSKGDDGKQCMKLTVADLLSQKEQAISLSSSPSTASNATATSDIAASSTNSGYDSGMSTIMLFRLDRSAAFTYADIVRATDSFSEDAMLGRGGSGTVYRGVLPDGRRVAVKQLQREGPEGEKEFRAEMEVLTRFGNTTSCDDGGGWTPHPNLVPMLGWCLAGSEKLLVYEYMEGGSLEDLITDWGRLPPEQRLETALGVAQALAFLHHECRPAVVHRDVKASNVLLDGQGQARVTDFGLARVVRPEETHVSTVVAGTVGYVAPEYGQTWQATPKGDVYSFGVLVMELATGRRALEGEEECLVERVRRTWAAKEEGEAPTVMANMAAGEVPMMRELLMVGVRCTAEAPQARPNMKEVLAMLMKIHELYTKQYN